MSRKKLIKTKLPKIPPLPDEADHMDLSQNTLLSTLLNDPASRAMVLQFMTQAQKQIEYKENQAQKVENKLKKNRFMCESPVAQFRRKELRRLKSSNSDSGSSSTPSTNGKHLPKMPFNELLHGLVIYVEVFSNGLDKSLSAKTLVQSMGAKVSDRIQRGVTHVIFKDGSYQTYSLAKRLKMHVVSILWLEAVKRIGNHVPEKDYPAFGSDRGGDLNVSTICKNLQSDFDDICQDERTKLKASNIINKTVVNTPKSIESTTNTPTSSASTSHKKSLFDDEADDDGDSVFLSAKSSRSAVSSAKNSIKFQSDFSSDKELVNGEARISLNNSLELSSNVIEKTPEAASKRHRRRTIYIPEDDTTIEINMSKTRRKTMFAVPVLKESNRILNKRLNNSIPNMNQENNMELTSFDDSNRNTDVTNAADIAIDENAPINSNSSNRKSKTSFESTSSLNSTARSSINSNSIDLTLFVNTRRRSVRIASKSEEMFKKPVEPIKDIQSKESTFSETLSSLRLSTESTKRHSNESIEYGPTNNQAEKLASSVVNNIIQSDSTTSLSMSQSEESKNKIESNQQLNRQSNESNQRTSLDNHVLQSQNLTSSLRLSDSQQLNNKRQSNESNQRMSTDSSFGKLVSFDISLLEWEKFNSSRLSEPNEMNNKCGKSELTVELSQLQIDSKDNSIEMSVLQLSESVKQSSKKRLSDEEHPQALTPSKKTRPETAKPKQKSISESSCSDESGKKKYRKLYDENDFIYNDEILLQIEECNISDPKKNIVKGRVKRAMELIAKPFELTPEGARGKLKSISSDSEDESNNSKTGVKKPLTAAVQGSKPKNDKIINKHIPSSSSNKIHEVFATPKTVNKKIPATPSRRSSRFVTPVTYRKYYDNDKTILDDSIQSNASVITPQLNRRSTMDFSTPICTTPFRNQKGESNRKKGSSKSGIACTRFKVGRVNTFVNIVRRLGRFYIDDNVVERTTHLVIGENKRTVNLLRAIARGCWILSADWLYKSMAAEKWLSEEDYEFTDFSDAVQFCRKEREAFGPAYKADTFVASGPIYIARRGTKPTYEELRELVQLAGGTVAPSARSATIVVGEVVKRYETVQWCVSELWLLDSITKNELAPCREYSLVGEEEIQESARKERRLSEDY